MIATYLAIAGLFLLGMAFVYWRNMRRFQRLNSHGIEQHASFAAKLKSDTADYVLLGLGYACVITGLVALVMIDHSILGWAALVALIMLSIQSNRKKSS